MFMVFGANEQDWKSVLIIMLKTTTEVRNLGLAMKLNLNSHIGTITK